MDAAPSSALLTRAQLADWLGVSPKTIARWDRQGLGPPRVRAGLRAIRYRVSDVLAWLERRGSAALCAR